MNRSLNRAVAALLFALALGACGFGNSDAEFISKGKALLDKRDFSGAAIEFKNALQKNPESGEARALLGRALLQGGDAAAALIALDKAQDSDVAESLVLPEIARAHLAMGDSAKVISRFAAKSLAEASALADLKTSLAAAYAAQGDMDSARIAADAALKAQAGYGPAVIMMARLDLAGGDMEAALRQLDALLAREPGDEAGGLLKAEILQRGKNDPESALLVLRQAQAARPSSVAAQAAVVDLLNRQGKLEAAKAELAQLNKLGPNHPDTLLLQAQLAFANKDFTTCLELTERLLAKRPNHPRLLQLAGAAQLSLGRTTLAEGLLARAYKVQPSPSTVQLLAQSYLQSGQADKAAEVLGPLSDNPKADATTLKLAAGAYLQAGDFKRSEATFQRALKVAPGDAAARVSLAAAQIARGDSGLAVMQLEAIANEDRGTQADLALFRARLGQRDWKGAQQAVDGLEKKRPAAALPHFLRGSVFELQGNKLAAAASFEKALLKQPLFFPAVARLAAMEFDAGKTAEARKRFQDLIKLDPKHMAARLALAELDTQIGTPEALITAQLHEATKADPSKARPHLILIERLLANGNSQEALAAAQDATAALPNHLGIMNALGRALAVSGDRERAVVVFKKLTGLQPKDPAPFVRLAEAYVAANDRNSAARALKQALELDPELVEAHRAMALLAVMDKRPAAGLAIAKALQQRRPKDAAGFALEGELHAVGKNWSAAATAYEAALERDKSTATAIKLHRCLAEGGRTAEADRVAAVWQTANPKDTVFTYYLGERASAAKDWVKAEAQFRAVIGMQPRNAAALNNVAWLMAKQGKPGASAMAERANALLPERASLIDTLSVAQEAENQLPKALETQKRAVALAPGDHFLRLRLAQLHLKLGNKSEARKELEALAKLGPTFDAQAEVATLLKTL